MLTANRILCVVAPRRVLTVFEEADWAFDAHHLIVLHLLGGPQLLMRVEIVAIRERVHLRFEHP